MHRHLPKILVIVYHIPTGGTSGICGFHFFINGKQHKKSFKNILLLRCFGWKIPKVA